MNHEADTLIRIAESRSQSFKTSKATESQVALENGLTRTLGSIMVAVENYPELKASQNFLELQKSENEVEEQLSAARRTFNAITAEYNAAVQMFPTNIIALIFNFKTKVFFEVPDFKKENPDIGDIFEN